MSSVTPAGLRRLYVPQDSEATYNGESASLAYVFDTYGREQGRGSRDLISDKQMSGTARDEWGRYDLLSSQTDPPTAYPMPASPEAFGVFAAMACGGAADSHTSPGGGEHIHTSEPIARGGTLTGWWMEDHAAGATAKANTDRKQYGRFATQLDISGSQNGPLTITPTIAGSGKIDTASSPTESGLTRTSKFFTGPQTKISFTAATTLGQAAGATAHTKPTTEGVFANTLATTIDWESFTFSFVTQHAVRRMGGRQTSAGIIADCYDQIANRTVTLNVNAFMTSDIEAILYDQHDGSSGNFDVWAQQYTLDVETLTTIGIGASYYSSDIRIPLAILTSASDGQEIEGQRTVNLTFEARAATSTSIAAVYFYSVDNYDGDFGAAV